MVNLHLWLGRPHGAPATEVEVTVIEPDRGGAEGLLDDTRGVTSANTPNDVNFINGEGFDFRG